MKYSRIAVRLFEREGEDVFYDPVYHGRTLKVFGMDEWPGKALEYFAGKYREMGYETVIFDTAGTFPEEGFDTVIKVEDGKGTGLDPIALASAGLLDGYTAATIVQTVYGLDRTLTERLYADFLAGKVKSVPEAAKSRTKYAEVIGESYTPLDEAFYSGKAPGFGGNVLVNLGETYSITLAGMTFLIVAAVVRKRRNTMIGVSDAAVLAYTTAGSAAIPLITRPLRSRVTVLATQYAVESIMNLVGPSLLLYHDPDTQSVIYETNGVPPGPMRKHVHKGQAAFIYRTPETIDVEWGEMPL
ncbi:hypothetical protein GQS_04275 [Thermococcus sp. 4557]|uniref:hypothetical protein n=1 Tax=Thermococcus sp. (strain CGMCC 1.5172 / 4557) TaxID=1042877 RepID=UPI000219EAB1|nr:hypothetical protein [Thermococcus sp. 4557]AEK72756.1 hypothetical protein GQS_04275 [Thermococcus sp. 4557]